MRRFQLIVLTPPGLLDPSIAIAASRSGELGVLDLEYAYQDQAARAAISKMSQYTSHVCGIKLDGRAQGFIDTVTSDLPEQVRVIILTPTEPDSLIPQVKALHDRNLSVLLETRCLDDALLGVEAKADGLIGKGNEAGGWVGQESTFVLLQRILDNISLPVWAQGGIGLHTSAACYVAGAAGVVLDSQLALTHESPLSKPIRDIITGMDGSETVRLGSELGATCRVYIRPRVGAVKELADLEQRLVQDSRTRSEIQAAWGQGLRARVGWDDPEQHVLLLGQDAAFAAPLAQRFSTVGGVLEAIREAIEGHVGVAQAMTPFDLGSPLARSHGTRYPVVQGPMAQVSDRAPFLAKVAEEGGLPFLALGVSRASALKEAFEQTQQLLGSRPWGVGLLGFVHIDLREEQLDLIRAYRPPFALIAGGRPEQALALEKEGIATYLHVPSPGLLKVFLDTGTRRFIFEGREAGGHIGPRSSFVLWNQMIDVLLESLPEHETSDCHVLFAGGIHSALSSSMVAALAAPLAERGVRIGVLMGTAYLFTKEAVATGAIVKGFQKEAIRCLQTVELETGPGHASRCAASPYVETFRKEKHRLVAREKSSEEVRNALEELNLGRLRIASKGIARHPDYGKDTQAPRHITVGEDEQHTQGMYMIGQLAALRDQSFTIKELHHEVTVEGTERLSNLDKPALSHVSRHHTEEPSPSNVAIIGMACLLPKAADTFRYWDNILNKVLAITEVPEDRWDPRLYFDPDPRKRDKVYSKWGGFLDAIPFDPIRYGMPPNTLTSVEPLQLLALDTVDAALRDAGYACRPFARERTSVIMGVGGGLADLGQLYSLRSHLPMFFKEISPEIMDQLPEWTEDSFPGVLLNVTAGRIANRFDLGGANYTVDAACASSLSAVYLAVKELENQTSDMVIVGGGDTSQSPYAYLCFSKTHALSPTGRCRTFDESADGTVISEGVAALVLKRQVDAERDGDRIYAVIKAVSASSDGRDKGLTAPRPKGQKRALDRAYAKAGISPATVDLMEAHGTGTVAGDRAEIETLARVFETAGAGPGSCALGSVKSMIGHTKCAAGIAGLIKVALALYHKVLPPTINVTKPNASLAESFFYVNAEARPWVRSNDGKPRRAGVSGFGFGGSNFHAVLEEYTGNFLDASKEAVLRQWPSELFLLTGQSREEVVTSVTSLEQALMQGARPRLYDLAYTLWQEVREHSGLKLAVVASSIEDLKEKLTSVRETLTDSGRSEPMRIENPTGIYFTEEPLAPEGRVAFLFPGQGSQYPAMLNDLAINFQEVRESFESADRVLADQFPHPLSTYVFPPACFSAEEEQSCKRRLTQTNVTQPAMGAANMGMFNLLGALGIKPHMVAGHSYGEIVALCAARAFSDEDLYVLSETRGRLIMEAAGQELGTMAAVGTTPERISEALQSIEDVWIANLNSPKQTIISGTRDGIEEAVKCLKARNVRTTPIAVSCAFHSPIMAPVQERLAEFLATIDFAVPQVKVFSNTSAGPYPQDPKAIGALLSKHLIRPVRFAEEVEEMYKAGARVFVEVGPRNVLTALIQQTLAEAPHLAVTLDMPGRSGLVQLQHALGQLAADGIAVQLDRLYQARRPRQLNLNALVQETKEKPLPPTTWMVNGGRAWPLQMPGTASDPELTQQDDAHSSSGSAPKSVVSQTPDTSAERRPAAPSAIPKSEAEPQTTESLTPPAGSGAPGQSRTTTTTAPISSASEGEVDQIMQRYQQMMSRFLEVQQHVMLAYLGSDESSQGALPSEVPDLKEASGALNDQLFTQPDAELKSAPAAPSEAPVDKEPELSSQQTSVPVESADIAAPDKPTSLDQSPPKTDREQLTAHILNVVSERTGYPPEMLDLDLDLEADLGIDSIKRVEILGTIRKTQISPDHELGQEAMEQLNGLKTLRGIIDWLSHALGNQPHESPHRNTLSQQEPTAKPVSAETLKESDVELPRFVLTAVNAPPIKDQPLQIPRGSILLITDEGRGVARIMADELKRLGGQIALVQMGDELVETGQGLYTADLTDPEGVIKLVLHIRHRQGAIGGIIHLLPLTGGEAFEKMSLRDWQARLRLQVKTLFYLARAAGKDLKRVAESGTGWLIGATAMGGSFAADNDQSPSFFPGQGAVVGLVKTLAEEWPSVRCKAVDLDPRSSAATLADCLLREMACADSVVEVGYKDSRRLTLRLSETPLDGKGAARLSVDSTWVVVVTGGARGITAEVALGLAKRYRPTLLLVGRSPIPEEKEPPETAGLASPEALKTALINKMRQKGKSVTPAQVEAACRRLSHNREMRTNLAAMQQAGARVHYYQADVSDELAVGQLIDEIYATYGRLDLFIQGAGIIEDKLLENKTPDSFDRVFDTKANSIFALSRKLRQESLRSLVLFSSVAGRFGNRGQIDYVAANEVLNKLAVYLDRQWPGRVVAINWGPWGKTGMASPEVQRQFRERGVEAVQPSQGRHAFDKELRFGSKGQVEVVIGKGPWEIAHKRHSTESVDGLPMIEDLLLKPGNNGSVQLSRTLDLTLDPYLQDHQLDGKPVLPAAMATELIAEVAQQGWPEWEVMEIRSLNVLKGIVLEDGTQEIRIDAQPRIAPSESGQSLEVNVEICLPDQPSRPCYRAIVKLGKSLPSPSPCDLDGLSKLRPFPMSADDAYRRWLFHGPSFQGISSIEGISEEGIYSVLQPSSPAECFRRNVPGQWVIDPVLLDSAFQLAILWERTQFDMTPLPSGFAEYRRFRRLGRFPVHCYLQAKPSAEGHVLSTNIKFLDPDGHLIASVREMEFSCTKALNRLAGSAESKRGNRP
jgi:acyl transferase domain-containing protein/NAD(P)H-dependent flavin oxidoreductase YrpB (nitropropane dioxygenase family)/NAD(P)-dependent dehydrogenase (short-subunit alcohol dehydrogenase family)